MSKEVLAFKEKDVEIDGYNFLITAFDAMYGIKVMAQLGTHEGESMANPDFIKGMVTRAVRVNNKQMTGEYFDKFFSQKYELLFKLVAEIIAFNFGEMGEGPNAEGDTTED